MLGKLGVFGRILLGIGYLSVPFAGPGASVLTASGWLVTGSEERQQHWALVGLVGLVGVAAVLASHYGSLPGLDGVGGVMLLLYEALAVLALWNAGNHYGSVIIKAAAVMYAAGLLLAIAGAGTGLTITWGSLEWAGSAAKSIIEALGGGANLARALAAGGGILAAIGLFAAQPRPQGSELEEALAAVAPGF